MAISVFYLGPSALGFRDLALVKEAETSMLVDSFDGAPMKTRWRPLEVVAMTEHPEFGTELGDYARLGSVPTFSQRAVKALGGYLTDNGELLPLKCSPEYFAFNTTTLLDALDEPRSSIARFASGKVMMVNQFSFRPDIVRTGIVFKLPQLPRSRVFVTDPFVQRAKEAGLRGFGFTPVWSDSPAGSPERTSKERDHS